LSEPRVPLCGILASRGQRHRSFAHHHRILPRMEACLFWRVTPPRFSRKQGVHDPGPLHRPAVLCTRRGATSKRQPTSEDGHLVPSLRTVQLARFKVMTLTVPSKSRVPPSKRQKAFLYLVLFEIFFYRDREENTGGVEGGRLTRLRRTKTGVWETDGKDSETEPRDVGNECRLPAP